MRQERDGHGRYRPGVSGNPRGGKPASAVAKLVEAAERLGGEIVIRLPVRPATDAPPTDLPPKAA